MTRSGIYEGTEWAGDGQHGQGQRIHHQDLIILLFFTLASVDHDGMAGSSRTLHQGGRDRWLPSISVR
jgi:hypothetical protein